MFLLWDQWKWEALICVAGIWGLHDLDKAKSWRKQFSRAFFWRMNDGFFFRVLEKRDYHASVDTAFSDVLQDLWEGSCKKQKDEIDDKHWHIHHSVEDTNVSLDSGFIYRLITYCILCVLCLEGYDGKPKGILQVKSSSWAIDKYKVWNITQSIELISRQTLGSKSSMNCESWILWRPALSFQLNRKPEYSPVLWPWFELGAQTYNNIF